jgi:hypothetical protein
LSRPKPTRVVELTEEEEEEDFPLLDPVASVGHPKALLPKLSLQILL